MTVKKFINNFEEYFVVWSLVLMVAVVFMQIVMRYVFSSSLSWSEELARYLFLWLSWMGASYAVKERAHFRVEMLVNVMNGRGRKIIELCVLLVWFAFCLSLVWYGTKLAMFNARQSSAAMQAPMSAPYASVPAGCALMSVRLAAEIWKILRGTRSGSGAGAA